MYWRIGAAYRRKRGTTNRAAFREIVKRGPAPGLLALDGRVAVGWCQLTPRVALPKLDRARWLERIDDAPVWSISCFYVRKSYRRHGVTAVLIAAALKRGRDARAPALEAYPLDRAKTRSASFTGIASTFERAGFRTVARFGGPRPIVRHDFEPT